MRLIFFFKILQIQRKFQKRNKKSTTSFQFQRCLFWNLLESGQIMATSSKADISETEIFFWIFYCVSEIYVKFKSILKKTISLIA